MASHAKVHISQIMAPTEGEVIVLGHAEVYDHGWRWQSVAPILTAEEAQALRKLLESIEWRVAVELAMQAPFTPAPVLAEALRAAREGYAPT